MSFIALLITGVVIGFIVNRLFNGMSQGVVLDIILAMVGAGLGVWCLNALITTTAASEAATFTVTGFIAAVLGAMLVLKGYQLVSSRGGF